MPKQLYDVDWLDRDGNDHMVQIMARTASEAERIVAQKMKGRPDFSHTLHAEPTE